MSIRMIEFRCNSWCSIKAKKRKDLASLKLAQADVNRYKPLVAEGLAPRVTLEQYQAKVEALKADIQSDDAKIKQAGLNLSYTIVKAPIDGQASRRLVDVGNLVGKSEATILTTINNTDPLYAYFAPSEEDFQSHKRYLWPNTIWNIVVSKGTWIKFLIKFVLVWPPANLTGYAISVRKVRALKIGLCPIINDRLRRSLGLVVGSMTCMTFQ